MSRKLLITIIVLLVLSACAPEQSLDQGKDITITKKIDSNLYEITLKINSDVGGYSQTQGSVSGITVNGYGSVGGAIWTDGKGLVRGKILSLSPSVSFAEVGDEIILKTTDFKIAALKPGDTVSLICTADYEPICSIKKDDRTIETCIDLWEFDFCRMTDFE